MGYLIGQTMLRIHRQPEALSSLTRTQKFLGIGLEEAFALLASCRHSSYLRWITDP